MSLHPTLVRCLFVAALSLGTTSCFVLPKKRMVDVDHPAVETSSGVLWKELLVGSGDELALGQPISVDYVCLLEDETPVDSSYERGVPVEFILGSAPVAGWNEGCVGMREGGRRWMLVPAALAYGEQGVPGLVPPNAPLIFEVELRDILAEDDE